MSDQDTTTPPVDSEQQPAPPADAPAGEHGDAAAGDPSPHDPPSGPVGLDALDKDALVAFADEHGLDVNKRLGEAKLREAIAAAIGHPATVDGEPPVPHPVEGAEYRARHAFLHSVDHHLLRFEAGQIIPEHLVATLVAQQAPVDAVAP